MLTMLKRKTLLWIISMCLLWAAPASAQNPAASFDQLRSLVKTGDTIEVTDASGHRTKGRLGELSISSLELLVLRTQPDGSQKWAPVAPFQERDVTQIMLERRDSLLNGTLIGLAAGGGIALYVIGISHCRDCSEPGIGYVVAPIPVGIGVGLGAAIDFAIRDRVKIYQAPERRPLSVHVSPLLSKQGAGVQMTVLF